MKTQKQRTELKYASVLLILVTSFCSVSFGQTYYGSSAGTGGGVAASYFGRYAGNSTTGTYNTFIGGYSGRYNTIGYGNTALGAYALEANTTGNDNIAIGLYAFNNNTTGSQNILIGYNSGYSGDGNVGVGYSSLEQMEGSYNVAIGHFSMRNSDLSTYSVSVGTNALYWSEGNYNTAIGSASFYSTVDGGMNTGLGAYSMYNNTSGGYNTALGYYAGYSNQTGSYNVFLGRYAGYYETGSDKLYIENSTTTSPLIYGDFSANQVAINTSTTGYTLNVNGSCAASSFTTTSDKRLKENDKVIENALTMLQKINGYTYTFKRSVKLSAKKQSQPQATVVTDDPNTRVEPDNINDNINENDGIRILPKGIQYGVMAQEIKEVLPDLVAEDGEGYLSVNYNGFVPILIEAVKEVSSENEDLTRELVKVQDQYDSLKEELRLIKSMLGISTNNVSMGSTTETNTTNSARLIDNYPNPFDRSTTIVYSIPTDVQNSQIVITNIQGQTQKVITSLAGKDRVLVEVGELSAGAYVYSLVVEGVRVDSKILIVK